MTTTGGDQGAQAAILRSLAEALGPGWQPSGPDISAEVALVHRERGLSVLVTADIELGVERLIHASMASARALTDDETRALRLAVFGERPVLVTYTSPAGEVYDLHLFGLTDERKWSAG